MSTRVYLAVDNDGTEKMSNSPLARLNEVTNDKNILNFFAKNRRKSWVNTWNNWSNETFFFEGIILPKGTIERLTGEKITFKDEPIIIEKWEK